MSVSFVCGMIWNNRTLFSEYGILMKHDNDTSIVSASNNK